MTEQPWPGQSFPSYYLPPVPGPRVDPNDPLVSSDISGWFARGARLARARLGQLLALQLLGFVLVVVATAANDYSELRRAADGGDTTGFAAVSLLLYVPASLVFVVVSLASVYLVVARATDRPMTVVRAVQRAASRFLAGIGWWIVFGLLIGVGLVLCVLPGLYVGLVATLLAPVLAVERSGVDRCFRLFHSDFGAAFGRAVLIALLFLPAGAVSLLLPVYMTVGDVPDATGTLVALAVADALVTGVLALAATTLAYPLAVGMYADLRVNTEPTSAVVIADQLGITPVSFTGETPVVPRASA